MIPTGYVDELRALGIEAGLDRVGVTTAAPMPEARAVIEDRKARGLHGGMQFTYRNPARSTDPGRTLPGARSLVVGARAYPADEGAPSSALRAAGPLARVARYATADHYGALRAGLGVVAQRLVADGWQARVLADDNALVDRAAAARAGVGWLGKSTNLLLDGGGGSYVVLGAVLTDAPLPTEDRVVADGCGACSRCLDACPTGALTAGELDARRCLAWLVQAEGVFPLAFREALGDRLYGCDECQVVCPPTVRGGRRRSLPPTAPEATWVPILDLLALGDDELLARFGRWYIPRREPRYLRRNALVVLGNTAPVPIDQRVRAALVVALADPDPLVRAHAVWAARRLGADALVDRLRGDEHPLVRAELSARLAARPPSRPGSERSEAPPGVAEHSGGPTGPITIRLPGAR